MPYELAVVIINYKTAEMTIRCAETALGDTESLNAVIVIVDNFSNDGSTEKISLWISEAGLNTRVVLIASPENLGFSGGNNLGMKRVEANFYMLLNSDTLIHKGATQALLKTFADNARIGIVSPRLEHEDGVPQISCFRHHSPISEFIDIANTGVITRLLSKYNVPVDIQHDISYPEWTSFACVVLSKRLIDQIGFMDEGFFLYFEDGDYCRMATAGGWLVANNPRAHVVHFRGGSAELKRKKLEKQRLPAYYFNSRSYYFRKHYGQLGLFFANLLWCCGRSISITREFIQRKSPVASEWQWLDIWKGNSQPMHRSQS